MQEASRLAFGERMLRMVDEAATLTDLKQVVRHLVESEFRTGRLPIPNGYLGSDVPGAGRF